MVFIYEVWAQRGASRQCEIGTILLQEGGREKSPQSLSKHVSEQYPRQACTRPFMLNVKSVQSCCFFPRKRAIKSHKTSCYPDNRVMSNPM